jgi:hypothetical protein
MKRSMELSHHRRANVWLDEAPPAAYAGASVVTKMVVPRVVVHPVRESAGVEIGIPHGPMASYALLGGELVEADVDGLEVIVFVNEGGVDFPTSLAGTPDRVKTGLLDEYANAVISGVAKVAEAVGAPTNRKLRFRWAAHGVVGSSPSIFERTSGIVLQLLTLPGTGLDDRIRALFG